MGGWWEIALPNRTRLFFFGTLMDPDVLRVVIGADLAPRQIEEGRVRGFRRVFVPGRAYPMLIPAPHFHVEGLLVSGLTPEQVHRLGVFEGPEYHLVPLTITSFGGHAYRAGAFLSDRNVVPGKDEWTLKLWRRRHKRGFLRHASYLMDHYGTKVLLRRGRIFPTAVLAEKPPKMIAGKPPSLGRLR